MSTERIHNDAKQSLRLFEEKNKETRPITPPSRRVLGQKPPETLVVLPPDKDVIQYNVSTKPDTESVERKNPVVKNVEKKTAEILIEDDKTTLQNSSKNEISISSESQQPHNSETMNSELENSKTAAPLELTAEFLSCVMNEDYDRSLELCKEILTIDPENKTCLEFKEVIIEKLNQEEEPAGDCGEDDSDDEISDDDESGDDESDDDESDDDESDDDISDDDDESEGDESDDEESDENSDEDNELDLQNFNLLMGGLPLRNVPTAIDENKH